MIISPRLSAVIPMNELRDKLKNKHIKVNINRKIKIKKKLLIILKKIIIKMR